MTSLLFYVLQVIICSGILYAYYHLFLRNKRFHQYNRFYILAIVILSLLIPAFNIPVYFSPAQDKPSVIYQTLNVFSPGEPDPVIASQNISSSYAPFFTWSKMAWSFYILVSAITLAKFIVAINKVRSLLRKYPAQKLNTIYFIETQEPGTPYSFFKWMFWNSRIELQSEDGQKIFRHELFHIQQKHSWDIILIELLTVIFWFNPFYHLVKKEIKAIHEFLADRFAIQNSENLQYAELLLIQALGIQGSRLTNPFFHNQIKRRIAMITTSQNPKYQYLRKIMVLPLLAIVLTLFAFKFKSIEKHPAAGSKIETPITVVIDAGHGGKEGGVMVDGVSEKDIALAIAKKIKELNTNANLKLVFTRLTDVYTGVKEAASIADKNKADIFISIHLNAEPDLKTNNPKKGMEVYISSKKTGDDGSRTLAASIINELQNTYDVNRAILKRQTGVWVLDAPKCTSVLIECGYLTNPDDFEFVTDEKNQEAIAKNILDGITKYAVAKEQGLKEDAEPVKFEMSSESGEPIARYRGKIIKSVSTYEPTGQLTFMLDGELTMLSKEKSSMIRKEQWPQLQHLYKAGIEMPAKPDTTPAKTYFYIDAKTTKLAGYYKGEKIQSIAFNEKTLDVSMTLQNGKAIYLTKREAERLGVPMPHQTLTQAPERNREVVVTGYKLQSNTTHEYNEALGKPLVVIDGVEKGNLNDLNDLKNGSLNEELKPDDIESINVLKDGSAIAKYGEKAINGVIEITTRKKEVKKTTTRLDEVVVEGRPLVKANDSGNKTFEIAEIAPAFPGGDAAFRNYIQQNIRYSSDARSSKAYGEVSVRFIVDAEGNLKDVTALNDPGYGFAIEAVRLIKESGKWLPAVQNGHKVTAYRTVVLPFKFVAAPVISGRNTK